MSAIIVAPFSNSAIRDWPVGHYAEMIGLLLARIPCDRQVHVIGTPNQRLGACEVVRRHPADRVVNRCGRMDWDAVLAAVRDACCVIGNNSGIAHVAGYLGTPTVCVFGGSHQRIEWRPRGPNVVVLSRTIACSPCQLDHGDRSPYRKACLREIAPADVADAAVMMMDGAPETSAGADTEAMAW